jgi:hypothetical protein
MLKHLWHGNELEPATVLTKEKVQGLRHRLAVEQELAFVKAGVDCVVQKQDSSRFESVVKSGRHPLGVVFTPVFDLRTPRDQPISFYPCR